MSCSTSRFGVRLFTILLIGAAVIGCPPSDSKVTVPNVVGQTQTAAQNAITGVGLAVGTVTQEYHATVAAGLVISQDPPAGRSVTANSAVNLVVSKGPGGGGDISNIEELQRIGNDPAYPLDGDYVLTQDIDASATAGWNDGAGFDPVGTWLEEDPSAAFTGTFDGQGHVITNLVINRPGEGYAGLFGFVGEGGVIENLGIEGGAVSGGERVGALAGGISDGTISECHVTSSVTGEDFVGGLVGDNYHGAISQCHATGAVTGGSNVGGLFGSACGDVFQCYATGAVTGTGSYVGGLAGSICGTVSQCFATGTVAALGDFAGGLAGFNMGAASECYAAGGVTGNDSVGGLAGENFFGTISQCYATGPVTGESHVGGLVGQNNYATVEFSFWDIDTGGQTESGGGTGLSTAEMQTEITFTAAGWDFDAVWHMLPEGSYPYLRALP